MFILNQSTNKSNCIDRKLIAGKEINILNKLLLAMLFFCFGCQTEKHISSITHGPVLGHVTDSSIRIWARTSTPGSFYVEYMEAEKLDWKNATKSEAINTDIYNDNTGWTEIKHLKSETQYTYRVYTADSELKTGGTFTTLPSTVDYIDDKLNPKGLYNFSFEFGCGNTQNPKNGFGHSLPTYNTLLRDVKNKIQFSMLNGDWLYEENRDYPVEHWIGKQSVKPTEVPENVKYAPTIVGVWENYKTYMSRCENLAEWHRYVPSYFTFDDHELINDIWGAGSPGHRNRRAVFRDIGTAAWYDYLGWADPVLFTQDVHFGQAQFVSGSDTLIDPHANFDSLDYSQMANLHVHWGTTTAGVDDVKYDVDDQGDPNSKVYAIEEVLSKNSLRLSHKAVANGSQSYSIGRRSYSKFTVANCDFYLLDTKTHREYHDISYPDKPGLSILGRKQRDWLMNNMQESNADFFFVVSSVPFMIPHIGAGGYDMAANKDESWTVFLDEREKFIQLWEQLDKPVFVLTGDLHNSFVIKISENIWEFCSGPRNSLNHTLADEGDRPNSGLYKYDQRQMDIRWSSFALNDIPRPERKFPIFCLVQINNVFNNPQKHGDTRWVAFTHPQVIFQYYSGLTGELMYAESVSTKKKKVTIYERKQVE